MSKVVQAFLSGMFFTFIMDFFLFLGIQINYLKAYDIKVYYNVLFADHQSLFIFTFFTILFGYVTLYRSNRISLIILGTMFAFTFSTLLGPIGNLAGEIILMKKDVILKTKNFTYSGKILYDGRKNISFYDHKLNKALHINKNNIIGEY